VTNHHRRRAKKVQAQLPTLPSGPTGPIQQIPLDSMAPVAPHVTYEQGQLTIIAGNSTLGDVLRAVHKQTGAEIEVPDAKERVVTHLGPGPAQEVIAELLNGSRFNYVLLGSPQNPGVLTRVVLVARSDGANRQPPTSVTEIANSDQAQPDAAAEANDADAAAPEENADDNPDQASAEAEQAPPQADQPGVKTPQELLQEMQQRQLQMQQQQPPGQPPIPGAGLPVRPQQENQ
jgi:hypothetical protein